MGITMATERRPPASHWKRVNIHMHPDVYREFKAEAAIRGVTLRELQHQFLVSGLRRRGRLRDSAAEERPA